MMTPERKEERKRDKEERTGEGDEVEQSKHLAFCNTR
jgi:hypothetical protein